MEYNFNVERIDIACFVPPGLGDSVHKNRANHGLAFHTGGDRYYVFGKNRIRIKANDLIYLPKGSDYFVESLDAGGCYAINFDFFDSCDFSPFSFRVKNSSGFLESFKQAEKAWRTKDFGYEMKCKSELYSIMYNLQKEYRLGYIQKNVKDNISPAVEYIHKEYTNDNVSIPYLSELCGMSETYFRRNFTKVYGVSPIKYINNLKICRAKELILSGLYTISDVSFLSGFHDESYFSREFKKRVGVSPSEYK